MKLPLLGALLTLALVGCSGASGSSLDIGAAPSDAPAPITATTDSSAPSTGDDASPPVTIDAGAPMAIDSGSSASDAAPVTDDAGQALDAGDLADASATGDDASSVDAADSAPPEGVACIPTAPSAFYPSWCSTPWACLAGAAAPGCVAFPLASTYGLGTLPSGVSLVAGPGGNAALECCAPGTEL